MAYDQCRLYRDALLTDDYLLQHVVLGSWQDEGLWATGAGTNLLRLLDHTDIDENQATLGQLQASSGPTPRFDNLLSLQTCRLKWVI